MSQPTEQEQQQTPKRQPSTSGIFSTFKSLTGGKSRTSSPNVSTVSSPGEARIASPLELTDPLSPPPDTNLLDTQYQNGAKNGDIADFQCPGGPPELRGLVSQLGPAHPIAVRTRAAEEVAKILERYSVYNVGSIWTLAEDMIKGEEEAETVEAGYKLLLACAMQANLTSSERKHFLDSIVRDERPRTSVTRLRILNAISNYGRNLECSELHVVPIIVRLLRQSYEDAALVRKRAKTNKPAGKIPELSHLDDVFLYTLNVTRFNSRVLKEQDLRLLGDEILAICKTTTSESDLSKAIELLDGIVTYSDLPKSSLRAFLEVLCGIYCQIASLKDQAWASISKIKESHYGPATISALFDILREQPYQTDRNPNTVRGAVLVIRRLLSEKFPNVLEGIGIYTLLPALKDALALDSARLDFEICCLILDLLNLPDLSDSIFDDKDWDTFASILIHCSQREIPLTSKSGPGGDFADPLALESGSSRDFAQPANVYTVLQQIADRLIVLAEDLDFDRKRAAFKLILRLSNRLEDSTIAKLIEYYQDERLLLPSNERWLASCHEIFEYLFKDTNRSTETRLLAMDAIHEAYSVGEALGTSDANALITMMTVALQHEKDTTVLTTLTDRLVGVAIFAEQKDLFDLIIEALVTSLVDGMAHSASSLPATFARDSGVPRESNIRENVPRTPSIIICEGISRLFLRTLYRSSWKAEKAYSELLAVAGSEVAPADARIVCLKILARLRSDINHALFIVASTECESLAATVCRTTESVRTTQDTPETPANRTSRTDDSASRRKAPNTSTQSGQLGRTPSTANRPFSSGERITRPTPPAWMYPGPKGLPEDPPKAASHLVYCRSQSSSFAEGDTSVAPSFGTLNLSQWLDLVLSILQQPELEWETYSYVVVHLGAQLTNHALFEDSIPQIKLLRTVICSQLQKKTFHEPPPFTNLKKSDVAICLFHILTMLVSYRHHFTRAEEDEMVKLFAFGIGSWERTSEVCIHALSVCCHEMPNSVIKALETILQKMSQIITQSQIAVHVLEFLAGLARLPELFRNFREDEFRMVFGICFRYLQYVRDQKDRVNSQSTGRTSTITFASSGNSRDVSAQIENTSAQRSLEDDLPQYVYALTYHVMTFWYMSLRLQDRAQQIPWIMKNLVFTDDHGNEVMEEQARVLADMMQRVAFSDRDETTADPDFAKEIDGAVTKKSWLAGMSILTLETAGRSGVSQITRRRPSGTRHSILRPQFTSRPRHQVPLTAGQTTESYHTSSYVGILPDDVVQETFAPLALASPMMQSEAPIQLPDDDATRRSLATFDRISALDGHKVGIIYVGENQTKEAEILANVMGSADFTAFLNNIGSLTELKGATFNTQGLDREFDTDGKFTFCWRDRVSEIVFHVPTMMPTNLEQDPGCGHKKKHIGNDFVNIIFNNSGLPFNFDTFPSDFNYVNIVITPEARASFVETRLHPSHSARKSSEPLEETEPAPDLFYKVSVMTKAGLPPISPAHETKILCGASLPAFVRLLALNASVFALVWANRDGGEHVSSWRSRLREIAKLRAKHAPAPAPPTQHAGSPPPTAISERYPSGAGGSGGTSVSQASARDSSSLLRRASGVFNLEGAGSRSSAFSTGTAPSDADRASSVGSYE